METNFNFGIEVTEENLLDVLSQYNAHKAISDSQQSQSHFLDELPTESPEDSKKKIETVLKNAVNARRPVEDVLEYLRDFNMREGFGSESVSTTYINHNLQKFKEKDLDYLFDPQHDENFYSAYCISICLGVLKNPDVLIRNRTGFGKNAKESRYPIHTYVEVYLGLSPKKNEAHKYFIELLQKFGKYYLNKQKEQQGQQEEPVQGEKIQFPEDNELYLSLNNLKKQLYKYDPLKLAYAFANNTIEDLIEYNGIEDIDVRGLDKNRVRDIYKLVRLVIIEHGGTLRDIPQLAKGIDWKEIISKKYRIKEPEKTKNPEETRKNEQEMLKKVFEEKEIRLKKEILDEISFWHRSNFLKWDFTEHSVDFIIEKIHFQQSYGLPSAKRILTLVKEIYSHDEKIEDLNLTPEDNWEEIICTRYGIDPDTLPEVCDILEHDDEEYGFNDDDDMDLPWKDGIDLFDVDKLADERNKEIIAEERKKAREKSDSTKNACKKIYLYSKSMKDIFEFDSVKDAEAYLNIGHTSFSRLQQGQTKLAKEWQVVENLAEMEYNHMYRIEKGIPVAVTF